MHAQIRCCVFCASRVCSPLRYNDDAAFAADTPAATLHMLRQQLEKDVAAEPHLSLADFVAPRSVGQDHIGMFVSSVFGCDKLVAKYEAENDDYNKIMAQSIADRLAEAYAELLHREMRTTSWGYAPDEVGEYKPTKILYGWVNETVPEHASRLHMHARVPMHVHCAGAASFSFDTHGVLQASVHSIAASAIRRRRSGTAPQFVYRCHLPLRTI